MHQGLTQHAGAPGPAAHSLEDLAAVGQNPESLLLIFLWPPVLAWRRDAAVEQSSGYAGKCPFMTGLAGRTAQS